MREKLEQAKDLVVKCKAIAKENAEQDEEDTNAMMMWLNYKI